MAGAGLTSGGACAERCPGPWRRAGGQQVGLGGLAGGQDTSLLVFTRASAFPRAAPAHPHSEPSPSVRAMTGLRPPSPGPWECHPHL